MEGGLWCSTAGGHGLPLAAKTGVWTGAVQVTTGQRSAQPLRDAETGGGQPAMLGAGQGLQRPSNEIKVTLHPLLSSPSGQGQGQACCLRRDPGPGDLLGRWNDAVRGHLIAE